MSLLVEHLKHTVKRFSSIHRPGDAPNVFLMATPRGGSTWLMEMIWSQPTFTYCAEPLNVRREMVRRHLGLQTWEEVYSRNSTAKLRDYFASFCEGRNVFLGPAPLRQHHRFWTKRIVFKIIHGAEDRGAWLCKEFNGRAVILLRHPIAVSLSRKVYPRLDALLRSDDYRCHFSKEQHAAARRIAEDGSNLERGVLSWALQNSVLLRTPATHATVVTYEQLVLDPEPVIAMLAERLDLPAPARMHEHLATPSTTTTQSGEATRRYLKEKSGEQSRRWLVEKWREQVSQEEERKAMRTLDIFEIDAYAFQRSLPDDDLWIEGGSS